MACRTSAGTLELTPMASARGVAERVVDGSAGGFDSTSEGGTTGFGEAALVGFGLGAARGFLAGTLPDVAAGLRLERAGAIL